MNLSFFKFQSLKLLKATIHHWNLLKSTEIYWSVMARPSHKISFIGKLYGCNKSRAHLRILCEFPFNFVDLIHWSCWLTTAECLHFQLWSRSSVSWRHKAHVTCRVTTGARWTRRGGTRRWSRVRSLVTSLRDNTTRWWEDRGAQTAASE